MDPIDQFNDERRKNITEQANNPNLQELSLSLLRESSKSNYSYNFDWLSRPIIQNPEDIVTFQEIVWNVKPDLIIETGIAHGGSLILSASLLALLDLFEYGQCNLEPKLQKPRCVVGIDIDIRPHNRKLLEKHPLYPRLRLIEGSSIDQSVIGQVKYLAQNFKKILVCLDSNHTYQHVLAELNAYAPLTSLGSYCIVYDTVIEDMPTEMFVDREWQPGNSPKTAVDDYLKQLGETNQVFGVDGLPLNFVSDRHLQNKLVFTAIKSGFLKRVN